MDLLTMFRERNAFLSASLIVLVLTVFLLPVIFLPSLSAPFQLTKTLVFMGGVLLSLVLAILGWLKEGSLSFPKSLLLGVVWLLPIAYLLSALLSGGDPAQSLVGTQFGTDTFAFIVVAALLTTLTAILFKERAHTLVIPWVMMISFALIALYGLVRLWGGPSVLSFGIFTEATANLVGKWNDFGIFSGLIALLSLAWLEILRPRGIFQIFVYIVLLLALFFSALVNFIPAWLLIGIVSLGFFMASVFRGLMSSHAHDGVHMTERGMRQVSALSLVVLLVSVVVLFSAMFYGNSLAQSFGITFFEARPSWQTTMEIGRATFSENFLFGSGPNTFTGQWLKYKTLDINTTPFWNVDFISGIGVIPTAFVTTGLVGILAWLLLLLVFVYTGVRVLLRIVSEDPVAYFGVLSSFIAAAYLWALSIVYVPNVVVLGFAFLFTGLFIGSLRHFPSVLDDTNLVFARNPRVGFAAVFLSTLVLLMSFGGLYLVGQQYTSWYLFQRAAVAANRDNDVAAAEGYLGRAIQMSPVAQYYAARANINLGKMQQIAGAETGDPDTLRQEFQVALASAVQDAQEATKRGPTNYQNWLVLGNVYRAVVPLKIEGAYENAKAAYDQAAILSPRDPFISFTLAQLEVAKGDLTAAKTNVEKALTLKENYLDAIFLSAQISINRGETNEAIRSVEAAVVFEPENPVILYQLGILYYGSNQVEKSIPVLERAVALSTTYANARYFLGLAYYRMGNTDGAVEQFEEVQKTNPDNEEVGIILQNLRNNVPLEQLNQNPVRSRSEQPVEEKV